MNAKTGKLNKTEKQMIRKTIWTLCHWTDWVAMNHEEQCEDDLYQTAMSALYELDQFLMTISKED